VIVGIAGRIQFMSAEAERLLYLAIHPVASPKTVTKASYKPTLPEGVMRMCRRLIEVFEGGEQAVEEPPV
jgi:hypothetical protein